MHALIALGVVAAAAVCPDPARPCPGFKAHDLSFARPADGVAKAEERSQPFFAVIVVSAARCSIPDAERVRIQALFPARKVFSARFECDGDVENNVKYTNVAGNAAFVAVHAGATRAEAEAVLAQAKAKGFAGANVRRMQAVFVHP
jgi:hypothetical protein